MLLSSAADRFGMCYKMINKALIIIARKPTEIQKSVLNPPLNLKLGKCKYKNKPTNKKHYEMFTAKEYICLIITCLYINSEEKYGVIG